MLKSKRFLAYLVACGILTGWLFIGGLLGGAWETTFKWCTGSLGAITIFYIRAETKRQSEVK